MSEETGMTRPGNLPEGSPRKRYRAPQGDGETLIDPPTESIPAMVRFNKNHAANDGYRIAGVQISELRESLRQHVLAEIGSDSPAGKDWFVSGHQPDLFHPGVWFKNHLLERIRRQYSAIGLHVIIDNDLCNSNSIRVPIGPVSSPALENVPFDDPIDAIPYEERTIQNLSLFESFGQSASDALGSLVPAPLLREHWHRAVKAARVQDNVGHAFSQLRQEIETEWGSETIEIPLSRLCQSHSFRLFLLHFIGHRSTFVEVYNRSLRTYRSTNRIRSRSHPVPALTVTNEWCELPFWVWQSSRPRRQPLLVRASRNAIELSDNSAVWRIPNETKTDLFLERIEELELSGVKIRPRALMTTLFLRLFLADVFLHGIGGAKYDELTDAICREIGIEPPRYVCATATARLPLDLPFRNANRLRELMLRRREFQFHPERFISGTHSSENQVSRWIRQKEKWIEKGINAELRHERHRKISEANFHMQAALQGKVSTLEREIDQARADLRVVKRLGSREFSFVLFPESQLRTTMQCEFLGG